MFYLKAEGSFDSAHFLKDYEGKCSNLHGHRWRLVAEIKGEELSQDVQHKGMLVDFGDLKNIIKEICDEYDHKMIYEEGTLKPATLAAFQDEGFKVIQVPFRPTAENFSKYFYDMLIDRGFPVHRVEVFETPNNCAAYEA